METVRIKKVDSLIYSEVFKKDFLGALHNGYVNSVDDVINIQGEKYILSSVMFENNNDVLEELPVTLNGQTVFTVTNKILPGTTPKLFVNGSLQRIAVDFTTNFTLPVQYLTWLNTDYTLETTDVLTIEYTI